MYTPNTVQLDRIRGIRLDLLVARAIPPIETLEVIQSNLIGSVEFRRAHVVNTGTGFFLSGWTRKNQHVVQHLNLINNLVPNSKLHMHHKSLASLAQTRDHVIDILKHLYGDQ